MKFLPILALSLFSMNALAVPMITEGKKIFFDSEGSSNIYSVPDKSDLQIRDNGKPAFSLLSSRRTGLISAVLDFKKSEEVQSDVDLMIDVGFSLVKLPVKETYLRIDPKAERFFKAESIKNYGVLNTVVFSAELTNEGIEKLPELLKSKPDKVNLFSYCYEVEGVTLTLRGNYSYNLNTVYEYFSKLPRTEATSEELRDSVQYMVENNIISFSKYGEGEELDYYASIARTLIKTMFKSEYRKDKYTLNTEGSYPDKLDTHSFNGREALTKDFCVKADLSSLIGYPELIK